MRLRDLRRVEFERLVEAGAFAGEPVELLGGELVALSPQRVRHAWAIEELTVQLAPLLAAGYAVRVQLPLGTDEVSLPEPDMAVTERQTRDAQRRVRRARRGSSRGRRARRRTAARRDPLTTAATAATRRRGDATMGLPFVRNTCYDS